MHWHPPPKFLRFVFLYVRYSTVALPTVFLWLLLFCGRIQCEGRLVPLSHLLLFLTKRFNDSFVFLLLLVTNCSRGSLCKLWTSDAGPTWELQLQYHVEYKKFFITNWIRQSLWSLCLLNQRTDTVDIIERLLKWINSEFKVLINNKVRGMMEKLTKLELSLLFYICWLWVSLIFK